MSSMQRWTRLSGGVELLTPNRIQAATNPGSGFFIFVLLVGAATSPAIAMRSARGTSVVHISADVDPINPTP